MRSSCSKNCCISIHAPTRGATNGENRYKRIKQFQYTLPRGERPIASVDWYQIGQFQSTLPRGERRKRSQAGTIPHDFNPRSHEGSDPVCLCSPNHPRYFNPRSHEGSDCSASVCVLRSIIISIHAPTRGATYRNRIQYIICRISIHAPTRGATYLFYK